MASIGKASQKYKEFSIIETNLLDAEKMVSKKFTADAIDEFQIQRISLSDETKKKKDLLKRSQLSKTKIEQEDMSWVMILGGVCTVSLLLAGYSTYCFMKQ